MTTSSVSRNEFRRFAAIWFWKVSATDPSVQRRGGRLVARTSGRRRGPATEAEIDHRRLGGLGLGVEELPRLEAERAGDEVARDGRDRRVVVEDGRVVVL